MCPVLGYRDNTSRGVGICICICVCMHVKHNGPCEILCHTVLYHIHDLGYICLLLPLCNPLPYHPTPNTFFYISTGPRLPSPNPSIFLPIPNTKHPIPTRVPLSRSNNRNARPRLLLPPLPRLPPLPLPVALLRKLKSPTHLNPAIALRAATRSLPTPDILIRVAEGTVRAGVLAQRDVEV